MKEKWKIEGVINILNMIMGVLRILLDQSSISSQDKDYYIDRMRMCFDMLNSLECMKDEKEEGD